MIVFRIESIVMRGETATAASFSRRLVKKKDAGKPLQPWIDKMNQMAQEYDDNSRPACCARKGFADEVVKMSEIRGYLSAFAGCAYQNPTSICSQHQTLTPRVINS